jgi:hypothetical protein
VKNQFQSLPFKCNLQRYTEGDAMRVELKRHPALVAYVNDMQTKAGLYKFANAVDS